MVKMGVLKQPDPEEVKVDVDVDVDIDANTKGGMHTCFKVRLAGPRPPTDKAAETGVTTADVTGNEDEDEDVKAPFLLRALSKLWSIISLRWLFARADKFVMIVWMELMFLIYWILALHLFYGDGVVSYWFDVLAPMNDANDPNAHREISRFINTMGIFAMFYIFSVYLFVILCIGFWKRNDKKLASWVSFNRPMLPLLLLLLIYSLSLTGISDVVNISLGSILLARTLVVVLVSDVEYGMSIENLPQNVALCAERMKKAQAMEMYMSMKLPTGCMRSAFGHDYGKVDAEKAGASEKATEAALIRTTAGQEIHSGNYIHPGCDYADKIVEYEKKGYKREEMIVVHGISEDVDIFDVPV